MKYCKAFCVQVSGILSNNYFETSYLIGIAIGVERRGVGGGGDGGARSLIRKQSYIFTKSPMDGPGTLTWEEFIENADSFIEISNKICDGWELRGNKDALGEAYLVRRKKHLFPENDSMFKIDDTEDDLNFELTLTDDPFEAPSTIEKPFVTEHHVLWSMSYGVPVLYFHGWKSDFPGINPISVQEAQSLAIDADLNYNELSQAIHPVLGTPFLHLHPCKSQELLQFTSKSKNKLVSWLSTIAPSAFLKLQPEYYDLTV